MRIVTRKVDNQPLTVIVEYPQIDKAVERVIQKVKHIDIYFVGKMDDNNLFIWSKPCLIKTTFLE